MLLMTMDSNALVFLPFRSQLHRKRCAAAHILNNKMLLGRDNQVCQGVTRMKDVLDSSALFSKHFYLLSLPIARDHC